jgi:Fe-S cluster assembly iron-binding protein IscA
MATEITPRALEVLRKGLATARLDPAQTGVRVRVLAGAARVEFAEAPEEGDEVVSSGGVRVFIAPTVAGRVIDVSAEHEQIVVRPA